jgi:hypothetical protein
VTKLLNNLILMKYRIIQKIIILISIMVICSCRKSDEAEIIAYEIVGQQSIVEINGATHSIDIAFPETFHDAGSLVADFLLSDGSVATINGVVQISGQTKNNYMQLFSYQVVAEDKRNTLNWEISAVNNPSTLPWGLGGFLESTCSNDREYEWYIDQANTGLYSTINCGPVATTMAAKWSDQAFLKTPEDARAAYHENGGWWYTADIDNYLNDNSIPHYFANLSSSVAGTQEVIRSFLDDQFIIILCLDMYFVRSETSSSERVDKFYAADSKGWGHFIVVKGYKIVNDHLYFEVYDPYSFGRVYSDGVLKGRNRYYRTNDIFDATSHWWNYAIVIPQKGSKKSIKMDVLNSSEVPSQWGR